MIQHAEHVFLALKWLTDVENGGFWVYSLFSGERRQSRKSGLHGVLFQTLTLATLYYSFLYPYIMYGVEVWDLLLILLSNL